MTSSPSTITLADATCFTIHLRRRIYSRRQKTISTAKLRGSYSLSGEKIIACKRRFPRLFGIRYPIVQAGMVWTSGWKLAVASARAGALGLIGAGSMKPALLREHIRKAKATEVAGQVGVNIPLIRGDVDALIAATIDEGVRIVFTSAGNPKIHIQKLKDAGCFVAHVIASVKHARKAEEVGCDAVVAEGFEAGGHNGIDEITTLCLVPQVVDAIKDSSLSPPAVLPMVARCSHVLRSERKPCKSVRALQRPSNRVPTRDTSKPLSRRKIIPP